MIIKNGQVFTVDGHFEEKDVYISNGLFTDDIDEAAKDNVVIDTTGKYVLPGLVDIHSHGAVGHDFCDASKEGLAQILKYEKSCGITSYCPTSMTLSPDMLSEIFASADLEPSQDMARIAGINMEGPFISKEKKGAQNEKYIMEPDVATFRKLQKESGNKIKLVTLAPELNGSIKFIESVKDEVVVSIGHTMASYDQANAAISAGANHVTHLFNAMPPFNHRDSGVVGAAIENENVVVEVICDGVHIAPSVIRTIFKLFGASRVALISDSMEATGMPDGEYELGKQKVIKKGNLATLTDGTIAGSATNLFDCMKKAVEFGIKLEDAVTSATITPAKSIGIFPEAGAIVSGKKADLLIVNKALNLERVL